MTIYVDRCCSVNDYTYLKNNELRVFSIFQSFQGEGIFSGSSANFVRLAGCNLGGKNVNGSGCSFCDTRFHYNEGKTMTFDEIFNKLNKKIKLIVLTGGEPMLQKSITEFCKRANDEGFFVQIETNGTLYRPIDDRNFIVVSPKVPELRKDLFNRANVLKFVVDESFKLPDYVFDFIGDLELAERYGRLVYVSPINVYKRELRESEIPCFFDDSLFDYEKMKVNYKKAVELQKEYPFLKINAQTHLLFGVL